MVTLASQRWNLAHPGVALQRALDWQRNNSERRKEIQKQYRLRNPQQVKQQAAKWQKANKDKVNANTLGRIAKKLQATPKWADIQAIQYLYTKAQQYGLDVDHIVPLRNSLVSGLHTWHNLQLLSPTVNRQKSNRVWPDMPEDYNSVGGR